jgi:hypothetical protein
MDGKFKTYLGDAVYAHIENGMIAIYTSNVVQQSTPIYLEDQVLRALIAYAERTKEVRI